ncbi:hypothetical protein [Phytomonospora endophytica]|uniref:WD40 repeat protein n=1 Tax=Phytomonospora endophytica TaxID=714109 RepID=A0A841G4W8_9ACTN|nr:hypothetical protein [Phytomonospora endophytica]MBB6039799.1 hypothetical protein [Phytomonospora endophytica]GIG70346.1 hypothetical protein Pen01_66410 [Phytomonospora endophytica]
MTLRDLSEGLRELAADAQPVDLHDRAIRTSRRLRARRAAAVMTGSLALVLVLVIGVSLSWHRTSPGTGMDAAERAVVDATDSASAYDDGTEPLQVLARVGYYVAQGGSPDSYTVYSWAPGSDPRPELSGETTFAESVAISPDGRYAAYYTEDRMAVADLSGFDPANADDVVYQAEGPGDSCLAPTWTQDSSAVVMYPRDADTSTMVELSGGEPAEAELFRPDGCDAQVFTYGKDIATFAFAYMDTDGNVSWEDAGDGTPLTAARTYPADDLGFLPGRLAGASGDGDLVCLSETVDVEALPARPSCGALATPKGLVTAALPVDGTLTGATFLNGMFGPGSEASSSGPDEGGEIAMSFTQDVMLRVRTSDDGVVVAQASYTVEEGASEKFGDATVVDFELVAQTFPEPPALADAYLLAFAP